MPKCANTSRIGPAICSSWTWRRMLDGQGYARSSTSTCLAHPTRASIQRVNSIRTTQFTKENLMFDHTKAKLGKKAPKIDSRTLRLAKYLTAVPPPPASCDWTKGVTEWGMMLNDALGDCTCAAIGH